MPRKTSTETKRGPGARRIVGVGTLVTAGELTAVTIFYLCKQVRMFQPSVDDNFQKSFKFLQDVNNLQ